MTTKSLKPDTKALCFDIFGTCVDWRKSVTTELVRAISHAANDSSTAAEHVKATARKVTNQDCADIAAEWRATYYKFTRGLANDPNAKFKTVDQHHHDALLEILHGRGLDRLFTDDEIQHLALVWHRLDSWKDTNKGLEILGKHYDTCTLSNGNVDLLKDMQKHSGMVFTHTFSGEMFGTYKPNPKVYLGAAERLGVKPEQIGMVAAHLGDLKAAKGCGLQTVFVERPEEEFGDQAEARREGYVDVWIGQDEDGFLALTKAPGLE